MKDNKHKKRSIFPIDRVLVVTYELNLLSHSLAVHKNRGK